MVEQQAVPEWQAEWKEMLVKYHNECKANDAAGHQAYLESEVKRAADMQAEEVKNQTMQDFQATFQAADTNTNGVLTEAEFIDFSRKIYGNMEAKGYATLPVTDDQLKEAYAIMNKITPGTDGTSPADIMAQVVFTKKC